MSTVAKRRAAWRRRLVTSLVPALLVVYPAFESGFYLELVTKVMILAIFAMSLELLVGQTGLVSFGHAAFFGVGAYALAFATPRYEAPSLWLTLTVAVLAAGAAAFVVGLLVVRVRGIYFIMVTLAFAQMFFFVVNDTELGRGSDGITLNFRPVGDLAGARVLDFGTEARIYYFVLFAMVAVYLFLRALLRSPFGHALQGIHGNEQRMRSLGFPVLRYKLASFTVAGAIGGLAGYLSAMQYGFVSPELLSWRESGNVLLMLILGGLGSLRGAVVGAFAFVLLRELFQSVTTHWQLLFGGTILVVVAFLPGGLRTVTERIERGLLGEEAR